ncbi:hypothetical protein RFI_02181 [Reticulomyxa filosa]|uniref:NF-X1-type domain-containing protein n=1 Tax=Reticulomyxa filosa TaxID=46433 RepID=X6PB88_RETFI|nr:hypothetical protein RFI_02181 [Reticulomyxa filosa]|eukprot:ETO34907.1 hypothetical protein RFI_02181 [Reticulomyxa filosa]
MCLRQSRIHGLILCGTVALHQCKNIWNKVLECGNRCSEYCHFGPCNRCTEHLSITCKTHNILVHNIHCWTKTVSCGNTCEQLLPCNVHTCQRSCHSDNCVNDLEAYTMANEGCSSKCDLPLPCGHKCAQKCHPTKACNASLCQEHVRIMCVCGGREDTQYCGGRRPADIRAIACGDVCKIAERNKRLREAFNIKANPKQAEEEKASASFNGLIDSNLMMANICYNNNNNNNNNKTYTIQKRSCSISN